MKLFLVGQTYSEIIREWDFQGVFDSEDKAINACKTAAYFYWPIKLNQELPKETFAMDGIIYPLAEV
jgi:hypothetical protein